MSFSVHMILMRLRDFDPFEFPPVQWRSKMAPNILASLQTVQSIGNPPFWEKFNELDMPQQPDGGPKSQQKGLSS